MVCLYLLLNKSVYQYLEKFLPLYFITNTLFSLLLYLSPLLYLSHINISPPFCQKCQRTVLKNNIYKVTPKWDKNSWCTLRIVAKVLSHKSCKIWHAERATCTSAESWIMWSATEKVWSWIKVLQFSMCFCIDPITGRSIFWISMRFSLILASSLRSSAWRVARYFIFLWCKKLEEVSAWNDDALACISLSILFNFSLISFVNPETSHSLAKSDAALLKEFSKFPKNVANSTYLIAICWAMHSSTFPSNFLLAFSINLSFPEESSLNF